MLLEQRAGSRESWHLLWAVVAHSLSHVWLFETPWTVTRQASLSFSISWSLLKPMSIESVMPCNHLILCRFLPGDSHGQRNLVGYRPWGHKESYMTWWLNHHHNKQIYSHRKQISSCLEMWSYEEGQERKITKGVKETSRGDEYLIILKMTTHVPQCSLQHCL